MAAQAVMNGFIKFTDAVLFMVYLKLALGGDGTVIQTNTGLKRTDSMASILMNLSEDFIEALPRFG